MQVRFEGKTPERKCDGSTLSCAGFKNSWKQGTTPPRPIMTKYLINKGWGGQVCRVSEILQRS
jgi:hypothetical protein